MCFKHYTQITNVLLNRKEISTQRPLPILESLYNWHREVKEQQEGLPIGLDLTRAVARLVLLDWDQQFLRLVRANNITFHLFYRYMDDTANGAEALRPGTRWSEEEERMILHPDIHTWWRRHLGC